MGVCLCRVFLRLSCTYANWIIILLFFILPIVLTPFLCVCEFGLLFITFYTAHRFCGSLVRMRIRTLGLFTALRSRLAAMCVCEYWDHLLRRTRPAFGLLFVQILLCRRPSSCCVCVCLLAACDVHHI